MDGVKMALGSGVIIQVFGKTLVHECLISYSHTERYFLFSDSATTSAQ